MSVTGEKRFVIKHTFKDVKFSEVQRTYVGDREKHFGIPWRIRLSTESTTACIGLDCLKFKGNNSWKITTETNGKIGENRANMMMNYPKQTYPCDLYVKYYSLSDFNQFLSNGNVTIELEVKITGMSGIKTPKLRNFDDEIAKEHSDVMLKIGDKKFYVNKMYLTLHSSYFKSLFSENFEESKKSEIELKDIDPDDMQKFLEVLHGELVVNDHSVEGILELADMYDSKTAIRHCVHHLMGTTGISLKDKFNVALQYKLDDLKAKCMSDAKTVADLRTLFPTDGVQYSQDVWKELYEKALNINAR